jgi:TM2 domain-containing membrane protein YozV
MNMNHDPMAPQPDLTPQQMMQQQHQQQMQMQQMQMAQMQQQMNQPRKVNSRTRSGAVLLALFLGGIGGHKFYLGQSGQGVLYLLFFWTFIPAFVALLEAIIYLTQSDSDFDQKYNY